MLGSMSFSSGGLLDRACAAGTEDPWQSRYNGWFNRLTKYRDILVTLTDCWQKSLRAGPI